MMLTWSPDVHAPYVAVQNVTHLDLGRLNAKEAFKREVHRRRWLAALHTHRHIAVHVGLACDEDALVCRYSFFFCRRPLRSTLGIDILNHDLRLLR